MENNCPQTLPHSVEARRLAVLDKGTDTNKSVAKEHISCALLQSSWQDFSLSDFPEPNTLCCYVLHSYQGASAELETPVAIAHSFYYKKNIGILKKE